MTVIHRLWAGLPRPLDPLRSIKVKFGVVVVVTACVAVLIVLWGYPLGFRARQTMPVGVLISLVVIQLLAHGMTAPLREMTAAARAMARGDYSRRVRATSRDEVGELAHAFNRMAADLAEVDRQRREFVANVSHELRTPISALRAVLENVADGVTPATPDVLDSALDQTERLGRLVTQLLDLSRADAGAASLDLSRLDVAAFVADVTAEAAASHPGARFTSDVTPGLHAIADRDRLHQVVANLLDNAARHGPPGAPVAVTARPGATPGALVLEVADEGPGIPPAERTRVFERFARGPAFTPRPAAPALEQRTPSAAARPNTGGASGHAVADPAPGARDVERGTAHDTGAPHPSGGASANVPGDGTSASPNGDAPTAPGIGVSHETANPPVGGTGGTPGGGTGLGLAIARWATDLHGGDITVLDTPKGCRIRVRLPGAPLP